MRGSNEEGREKVKRGKVKMKLNTRKMREEK